MSNRLSAIDIMFHHTILVDPDRREKVQCVFITRLYPVEYKTDNNFLPCWAPFIPELGLLQVDNVSYVLHDAMQGPGCEYFILVVVCNGNEHLRVPIIHGRAEVVSMLQSEFVRITCGCRIYAKWPISISEVIRVVAAHISYG